MPDDDHYVQRTEIVKTKKDGNKINRWVVQPIKKLAEWEVKDPKRSRVEA